MSQEPSDDNGTAQRKLEHLEFFREGPGVPARSEGTWLDSVRLVHCALPELDFSEIDTRCRFAGHDFALPLFITGMTGGAGPASRVNRCLAQVAQRLGVGFGLGSQRAMLQHPERSLSYQVRDVAPDVFLAANLGAAQVARLPVRRVRELVDAVGADALCVHLNPAQELAQAGGDRSFSGVLEALRCLVEELGRPLIVKEVGAGLSREVGLALQRAGVRWVDVAGLGGTSWVGVELLRRGVEDDPLQADLWDWGLPTAASLCELDGLGLELMASGGLRTGLDLARAIALGARVCGVAAPVLHAYYHGGEAEVERYLLGLAEGLKRVMLLTGARDLDALRAAPRVILDPLATWLRQRVPRP